MTMPRFFRNPETGEVVIAQWPNAPLWVFIAATAVRIVLHPHGDVAAVVSVIGGLALAVWAILEIKSGESPFRRVLGAVVLVAMVAGRLLA